MAALVLGLVVIVAFSNEFGRARPTGAYWGSVPPPVLTNGCYPLPHGVTFDFPHQVRTDGDVDGRRRLVLQYDLIDEETARRELVRAFTREGFRRIPGEQIRLSRSDARRVTATVTPLDVPDDATVRGTIELDLPVADRASGDPHCRDPYLTKRFPDGFLEVDE